MKSNRYLYNGKEEVKDMAIGLIDFGSRSLDPALGRWNGVDKMSDKMSFSSPFVYGLNNPILMFDPNGQIPFPVNQFYRGEPFRIDSWYGARNSNLAYASKNHKGLDINFGGGRFDYGAPVLTTHTGKVSVKDDLSGNTGRMVTVTSPDGTFRTKYMHLKSIDVKDGQNITEANQIGEIGGSRKGDEYGGQVHLHYQIEKYNPETKKWEPFNPTDGEDNSKENVVDPQKWIDSQTSSNPSPFLIIPMKRDNTTVVVIVPVEEKDKKQKP